MPRQWQLEVQPWDPLDGKRWYRTRVVSIARNSKPAGINSLLENLEGDQAGRRHSIILPPPRPEGLTAEFFRACGMKVAAGVTLTPKDTVGTVIRGRFVSGADDDGYQASSFEPVERTEITNAQRTSKSKQHAPTVTDASESP